MTSFGDTLSLESEVNELFRVSFEPSILTVINFDTAYYAKKMPKLNFAYPPIKPSRDDLSDDWSLEAKMEASRRVSQRHNSVTEPPIQNDIFKNLSQFCFPSIYSIEKRNILILKKH